MKIIIESQIELPNIVKDFALLTDQSKIIVNTIEYDKINGTVKIFLKRKVLVGFRKTSLSTLNKPIYKPDEWTDCIMKIKKVKSFELIDNSNRQLSEFTTLMGIQVGLNDIYISSAEEIKGNVFYEIKINIENLDVEFVDV